MAKYPNLQAKEFKTPTDANVRYPPDENTRVLWTRLVRLKLRSVCPL